jgi:hypothetical protein
VDSFEAKEAIDYLKDRMNTASAAQSSRLHALEVAIDNLAHRIKPVLGNNGSSIDPHRLDRLEAKVQQLVETIGPMLQADAEIAIMSPTMLRKWAGDLGEPDQFRRRPFG